jgi:hypothetical protein
MEARTEVYEIPEVEKESEAVVIMPLIPPKFKKKVT